MLDAFADYVGLCWTNIFFLKNVEWKFKSVQTFIQHFFSFFSCWMMLDPFSGASNMLNQHFKRKMSISIKFEHLNVRMPIRIYCSFGQLFLSFYKMNLQSGEALEQTKETIKKWQEEMDIWNYFISSYDFLWSNIWRNEV